MSRIMRVSPIFFCFHTLKKINTNYYFVTIHKIPCTQTTKVNKYEKYKKTFKKYIYLKRTDHQQKINDMTTPFENKFFNIFFCCFHYVFVCVCVYARVCVDKIFHCFSININAVLPMNTLMEWNIFLGEVYF